MVTLAAVEAENRKWVGWLEGRGNDQSLGGDWGRRQGVGNGYAYCNSFSDMTTYDCGYRHWDDCTFGDHGCAYTPTTKAIAIAHGEWIPDRASQGMPADLQIGDRPLYSWNGNDIPDHIGSFIIAIYADLTYDCIEGNTGSPEGVHIVRRDRKFLIGVQRLSKFTTNAPQPTPTEGTDKMFSRSPDPACHLVASHSGLLVEFAGGEPIDDGRPIVQSLSDGGKDQRWRMRNMEDGSVVFVSRANDKAIDLPNNSSKKGSNLKSWSVNDSAAQRFRVVQIAPYIAKVVHVASGLVWDISGGSGALETGVPLVLWEDNGGRNQQFVIARTI